VSERKVLDFILKDRGLTYAEAEKRIDEIEREEAKAGRESRIERRLNAEKARSSEHEKVGRGQLGKTLFIRVDQTIITKEKDLKCPHCGAALPELGAHMAAAGEVFQNRVDRGGRPWTKSSFVTCSKCQRKYEILSVLM